MNIADISDHDLEVLVTFDDLLGVWGQRVVRREVQRRLESAGGG